MMKLPSCSYIILIASEDITARLGSLSSDFERFIPWKVMDDKTKESD